MKECGWGSFSLIGRNLPIWRKKTKSEAAKNGFWKVSLEALEKEIKGQPQDPPKEEGPLGNFWGETSKEEYSEKMSKWNVADTTLVLVPTTANSDNQWHTKKP